MAVAQQLYEGIDLGAEGAKGLITYMRTDSVRVAREAQAEAREWITARLGLDYVPDAPPAYRSRGSAQEAHEAIRPSEVRLEPRSVARFLTKDQLALYRRSEEHTSELQSHSDIVCRLLLEKKNENSADGVTPSFLEASIKV